MRSTLAITAILLLATPALADLQVAFDEGAPKDRFTFTNASACDITNQTITLDLAGSDAGLIFDVTAEGAGIEVFQPFEIVSGATNLRSTPTIKDGDTTASLQLSTLKPSASFAFTIDLDDTTSTRGITVSGSEIAGARVMLTGATGSTTATFGTNAKARLKLSDC